MKLNIKLLMFVALATATSAAASEADRIALESAVSQQEQVYFEKHGVYPTSEQLEQIRRTIVLKEMLDTGMSADDATAKYSLSTEDSSTLMLQSQVISCIGGGGHGDRPKPPTCGG